MKTKKIFVALSVVTLVGVGYLIARAAIWDLPGFAWIGNNLQNGAEQGDPVIGMVSTKGPGYGISTEGESDQRSLVGSAWFGIGTQDDKFNDFSSQNDLPSLGWIHFNQPFDQSKLNSLVGGNCFGAGDCHGVRWNRKPGTASFEGYLSGWARLEVGPNGDTTPYPDVWVHFKSPVTPSNYGCNEGDHNYYVCADGDGRLEGYAWSAGADAVSIEGNPGLGWIKFSKKNVGFGVVPARSNFCATLLDPGSSEIGCKNESGFTGDFKFKAYQSGITLNSSNPDNNFQWTCEEGDIKAGEGATCNYSEVGSHTPKLRVYDEATQKWIDCASQTSVKVTTEESCSVLARKTDTRGEDFGKSATIGQNDSAEVKIDRQCLKGGEIKWTVTGGIKKSESGDNLVVSPSGTANVRASAQVVKDGKTYNCGSADVRVTETIKWR